MKSSSKKSSNSSKSKLGLGAIAPVDDSNKPSDIKKIKSIEGLEARPRLDRPARARGGKVSGKGKTTVNVILGGAGGQNAQPAVPAPVVPMPIPMPEKPIALPNMANAPVPNDAPMPMPARKNGGKVMAGAGSGVGRLNKVQSEKRFLGK